jgi:hypothetical protein
VTELRNKTAELSVALQQVGQAIYGANGDGAQEDEGVAEGEYETR